MANGLMPLFIGLNSHATFQTQCTTTILCHYKISTYKYNLMFTICSISTQYFNKPEITKLYMSYERERERGKRIVGYEMYQLIA